jgi:hypothetical protein
MMRNYLSFGGGVNSVALYLLLMEQGLEPGNAETGFEAVYVWMPDWPETHEYLMMMEYKGYPVTVIMPNVRHNYFNLIDFCSDKKIIPFRQQRWCTADFKIKTLQQYFIKPCFVLLGIDYGEHHRAVISSYKNTENRYPLIEHEINRQQCIDIIKKHGLPIPIKSGCWICPFQKVSDIKKLRKNHQVP